MNTPETFRHPLATYPAGAILGYRADGRPIYAIAGGDGTGEAGTGGDGGQGAAGGDTGQQGQSGQDPNGQQQGQQPAEGDESTLPPWAQKALTDARAEAGKTRVTAKQKAAQEAREELLAQFTALIDPSKGEQPATAEQLTQQLTQSQQQARQTAVELTVYRTARDAGGDPDALLDSVQFVRSLADIDPTDTAAVTAAIQAAVTANPKLGTAPAGPARGGTDFTGQQGGTVTPAQFAAMGYAARAELFQNDPGTYRQLAGS
ncbi:hypothetical protein HXS80_20515 [Streptomyces sp. CB04723]|uniref:hypothetical protein n=1 Tax=Streptomyces TaxID=1883 RepID=UPI0015C4B116|nr:hypothetical protein [Streptomyces sp. CB04723]QLG33787.1 hypothetical protein HXS80_20515 [Streptomyces sp. CB04723]